MRLSALAKTGVALAFFCLSFLLAPAFAPATDGPPPPEQAKAHPSIQVPAPEYNFGTAIQGETVEHAFTVKNTGREVLRIEHVKVA
jgi:hypothetical protein